MTKVLGKYEVQDDLFDYVKKEFGAGVDRIVKEYEEKQQQIHEDYRTGKSDELLHARKAWDLLAQIIYDLKKLP